VHWIDSAVIGIFKLQNFASRLGSVPLPSELPAEMQKLTVILLATFVGMCTAYRGDNFFFPADTTLSCMVQNPLAGYPGQPYSIPENVPRISFQPGKSGEVFLPVDSGFKSPVTGPLPGYIIYKLRDFLGSYRNSQLTSIGDAFPVGDPVLAADIIPVRIPLSGGGVGVVVGDRIIDYSEDVRNSLIRAGIGDVDRQNTIIRAVDRLTQRCALMARWEKLPEGQYFPQWFSGSFCSGNNCSLPTGLTCEPVLTERSLLFITVLRWDCCWSIQNLQWRWECGWRKVMIPIIGQCHCGCGPFYGIHRSHTGRIAGPFKLSVDDLNT
jgi:hypothetical protein